MAYHRIMGLDRETLAEIIAPGRGGKCDLGGHSDNIDQQRSSGKRKTIFGIDTGRNRGVSFSIQSTPLITFHQPST
jgi:hypothetical protein